MPKILMTSVRPDEQAAIQAYAAAHQIKISTTPKELAEALDLLTDVDGVIIQQRGPVPAHINAGNHSLTSGLFVPRGPVCLPGRV